MKIRFSPAKIEWLKDITGIDHMQEAVDFFVECMRKEGIAGSEIVTLIEVMMERNIRYSGDE